jgi:hypothetical protein
MLKTLSIAAPGAAGAEGTGAGGRGSGREGREGELSQPTNFEVKHRDSDDRSERSRKKATRDLRTTDRCTRRASETIRVNQERGVRLNSGSWRCRRCCGCATTAIVIELFRPAAILSFLSLSLSLSLLFFFLFSSFFADRDRGSPAVFSYATRYCYSRRFA